MTTTQKLLTMKQASKRLGFTHPDSLQRLVRTDAIRPDQTKGRRAFFSQATLDAYTSSRKRPGRKADTTRKDRLLTRTEAAEYLGFASTEGLRQHMVLGRVTASEVVNGRDFFSKAYLDSLNLPRNSGRKPALKAKDEVVNGRDFFSKAYLDSLNDTLVSLADYAKQRKRGMPAVRDHAKAKRVQFFKHGKQTLVHTSAFAVLDKAFAEAAERRNARGKSTARVEGNAVVNGDAAWVEGSERRTPPAMTTPTTGDPDFDAMLKKCFEILDVKGQDYTVGSKDRLHNFRTVAEFSGVPMEKVWSAYFYKHVAAVFNYAKSGGQSESEPIANRIADCINYLLLFSKMVAEKKGAP